MEDSGTQEQHLVARLARGYETALATGDTTGAAGCFEDGTDVSRLGPEGLQQGSDEITALRGRTPAVGEAKWLHESCRLLAPGIVLHLAVLQRGAKQVQRTQIWRLGEFGWRVTHAHVSRHLPS